MADKKSLESFDSRPPLSSFEKESTGEKVISGIAKAAPVAGGILGGITGSLLGTPTGPGALLTGAAGTAIGTAGGLTVAQTLKDLTGMGPENKAEELERMVELGTKPGIAGGTDLAFGTAIKALQPVGRAVKGAATGLYRAFVPKNASKEVFKAAFKAPKVILKTVPESSYDDLIKYNFSGSYDDMAKYADSVTGSNGLITKATRQAVGKIKTPVSIDDAMSAARFAQKSATLLDEKIANKTLVQVTEIVGSRQGAKIGTIEALDALDAEKELARKGYELLRSASRAGGDDIVRTQQAKIYLSARDALADTIDASGVSEEVIKSIKVPELVDSLRALSPELADDFLRVDSISKLRSLAKPFVDGSRLIKEARFIGQTPLTGSLQQAGRRKLLGGLSRPESATEIAQSISQLSTSPLGKGVSTVGRGVSDVAGAITSQQGLQSIERLLVGLGLMQEEEK